MNLHDPHCRAAHRMGWTLLALFLLGGLSLEFLHLIKAPWYFDVRIRRELWTLAHAHGALMAVLNILFSYSAMSCLPLESTRRWASRLIRWGAVLVPLGFLLGGIGNSESDPSLFIVLTPVGALMVLGVVTLMAAGAWQPQADLVSDPEPAEKPTKPASRAPQKGRN